MELTSKSVMVIGGAGFIGSHLVDRIIEESPGSLVVVDNLFLGKEVNLDQARLAFPGLKFYCQDATGYEGMKQIITTEGVNIVFNLAVVPLPASLERPRWTMEVNVAITTVACELLREGRYQMLVHFSSSEAYGSAQYVPMDETHPLVPSTPYAASKVASDYAVLSYCKTFGLDATILRPFNNYGPRQNDGSYAGIIPTVIRRVLENKPIDIFGDGEQTRDFVFVRDTVEAAIRLYEIPRARNRVVNVASGRETSINELVQAILEIMEVPGHPVHHVAPRPGDIRRHFGGVALVQSLLGFGPQVPLSEGLRETVAWYLES